MKSLLFKAVENKMESRWIRETIGEMESTDNRIER